MHKLYIVDGWFGSDFGGVGNTVGSDSGGGGGGFRSTWVPLVRRSTSRGCSRGGGSGSVTRVLTLRLAASPRRSGVMGRGRGSRQLAGQKTVRSARGRLQASQGSGPATRTSCRATGRLYASHRAGCINLGSLLVGHFLIDDGPTTVAAELTHAAVDQQVVGTGRPKPYSMNDIYGLLICRSCRQNIFMLIRHLRRHC